MDVLEIFISSSAWENLYHIKDKSFILALLNFHGNVALGIIERAVISKNLFPENLLSLWWELNISLFSTFWSFLSKCGIKYKFYSILFYLSFYRLDYVINGIFIVIEAEKLCIHIFLILPLCTHTTLFWRLYNAEG